METEELGVEEAPALGKFRGTCVTVSLEASMSFRMLIAPQTAICPSCWV